MYHTCYKRNPYKEERFSWQLHCQTSVHTRIYSEHVWCGHFWPIHGISCKFVLKYEVVPKTFFHLFNVVLLNVFILNKKSGKKKLSKDDFLEHIANYLLKSGSEGATCLPKHSTFIHTQCSCLTECHFIQNYTKDNGRKVHPIQCAGCNFAKA